uniref:Putative DNA binding, helix-turn-helix domain containing protein n=1 Tax=viral metagenome TaxID=1070528 RepID=A0A6M3L1Q1_9ZZZZ
MRLNIKKLRSEMKRQHMKQSELARRLGVTPQRVHYILNNGTLSYRVTDMLARVLNVNSKDLIL